MKRKSSDSQITDTVQPHSKLKNHDQIYDAKTKSELIEEIRKLKTQNDQLREALDAVTSCVCITEEDGHVIFMNRRCKDLLNPLDQTNQNDIETQKDDYQPYEDGANQCNCQTRENNSHHDNESPSHHTRTDFSPMSISELTSQTPPQPLLRQCSSNNNPNHAHESKSEIGDNFFIALGSNSNANELCFIPKPLKATVTRTDPQTKKDLHFSLVCETHDNLEGGNYLINIVTEANVQQKMACEIYRDIVEHFSAGISVWCLEDKIDKPTFRIVGMNKHAREKLNSSHIEVGLTLPEILKEASATQIAATFSKVLHNNKEISLDQFTLDGKSQFSVKITPFKYNCVGVMLGNPKMKTREKREKEKEDLLPQPHVPPMNYSIHSEEIFKQAFEYNPMMMGLFKRVNIGNRIDFQFMISNSAGRSTRKKDFTITDKMYLSELFPVFLDQKFMQQIASSQIGKPMLVAVNDWTNEKYNGGIYFGKFTRLPNDALMTVFTPLSALTIRQQQAVFSHCCQQEYNKDDLKDIHIFSTALENIAKTPLVPTAPHLPYSSQHPTNIPLQPFSILPPLSPPTHFHHTHDSHDIDFLLNSNSAPNSYTPSLINEKRNSSSPAWVSNIANIVAPNSAPPSIPSINASASSADSYRQHQLLLQVLREQQVRQQLLLQQIQLQAEKQQLERDKLEQDKAAFQKELESHRQSLPFLINSINAQGLPDVGLEAFKVAFHDAPVGMALLNTHGSILAANNNLANMLGYTTSDMLNNTFVPITHPDDIDSSIQLFKSMLSGQAHGACMLKRYVHKDGHAMWCLLSTTLARDGSGNPLVFISSVQLLDSLKAVLSGEGVKQDEEMYRQIFNKSNVGMSLLGKDGRVQNANNAFLERMHWHTTDVIGKPYFNFFIKEDQENIRNLIQTMAEGRILRHQTLARIEEANGDAFWCFLNLYCLTDANGVVTHVLAKFQDVEPLQKLFSQHTFPKPKGRREMQLQQQ